MIQSPYFLDSTDSTNNLLKEMAIKNDLPEGFLIYTNFQTAGKGQPGNSWESEAGKNCLFSLLLRPTKIKLAEHFILAQVVCVAIKEILNQYTDEITIKWPNDLYWRNKKICGFLIENSLSRNEIGRSVVGIGLNINQEKFFSDAPNPISLKQITGKELDCYSIMMSISNRIMELYNELPTEYIRKEYFDNLHRKEGYHTYRDVETNSIFKAKIATIQQDGKLILETENKETKSYYFKEVEFVKE